MQLINSSQGNGVAEALQLIFLAVPLHVWKELG